MYRKFHEPWTKDARCEYGNNKETVKKIELIMRCVMMMQREYQTWNRSL